ncbi:hypothetical protein MBLNU230_g1086t1 [Neophaeotheca triangularis]
MSGAAQGNNNMAKATGGTDPNVANSGKPAGEQNTKPRVMEEDDEFEDFPTEDWPASETVSAKNDQAHMWEETWDDDDTAEDFSVQLR